MIDIKRRKKEKDIVFYEFVRFFLKLFTVLLVLSLIFTFVFGFLKVKDDSMFPNVNEGDLLLYYRLDKKLYIKDVVVLDYNGQKIARRIVAMPGDVVDITKDGLKVNGSVQISENIFKETNLFKEGEKEGVKFPLKLKENEYFILSDNRDKAMDSRLFGAVDKKKIRGKIFTLLRRRAF